MSCHVSVVSSFLILFKTLVSSQSIGYVHLDMHELFTWCCPNIFLVLLNWRLALSQLRLVLTQNSTYFVKKVILYCPKFSHGFVKLASCTVLILTCTYLKLTLICGITCQDFDFISNCPFCNNDLVLPFKV